MYTDEEKVRQILTNLLSNAIKFTNEGQVSILVATRTGRVRFEVADTGIGISEQMQERIFEEFEQEQSSGRAQMGTGLGLTISRQLARMLGGDISVKSILGEGSTFTVDLPERYQPPQETAA